MAARKNQAATSLSPEDAMKLEASYRAGVDISLYELADRFEADGHDWQQALKDCGYSAKRITDEVEKITPRKPKAEPKSESVDPE